MSRKSSNDNRSNQLNPNNAEYWNCRGEGRRQSGTDDYADEAANDQSRRFYSRNVAESNRVIRKPYYFAATTFDGTAVYVRFAVEVQVSFIVGSERVHYLAETAKEALLDFMRRKCPLGVAYWRLATDDSRGEFYWYTPGFLLDAREKAKAERWSTSVRDQSQKMDLLFDWGKHDAATDLGVIKDEAITFAPESDDLLEWRKQQSS